MKILTPYQVVEISGKQFLVQAGDVIEAERLNVDANKSFKFDKVLLSVDRDKVELGEPYLKGSFVSATVIKHFLGPKVTIAKFKAKTGYRRKNGFRPSLSQVKIDQLN